MAARFSYEEAFSRNLGWVTEWEQKALRAKCVAIAGLGGVGGVHLLTLTRLGVGAFHIADPDRFELVNFNRQIGATLEAIGRPKVEVMAAIARSINPELRLVCFESGVDEENIDDFLKGADLYLDGLDFFQLGIRRKLMARCTALGIPAVTVAPIGMGAALLVFKPDQMSFEEWFRLEGLSEEHQFINFLLGLTPAALHRSYLVDPTRVNLRGRRGPSTAIACELCAGVAAAESLKLLLGRGNVKAAPYYRHFDAYLGRLVSKKMRGGNANPVQRAKIALARRFYGRLSRKPTPARTESVPTTEMEQILDVARWTPSGDNCQPWRFELTGENSLIVHLIDQSSHDLYDYRGGECTLLAGGMLLQSMKIAASAYRRGLEWRYQGKQEQVHRVAVTLPNASANASSPDPLLASVLLRSVDRRPYRWRSLAEQHRRALEEALAPDLRVEWHDGLSERWRLAQLGGRATAIRLETPELLAIHRQVIDWTNALSASGIPAAATGLDRLSRGVTRWALQSWSRTRLLNFLGGRAAAALQLDYLPGLFSASFFVIRRTDPEANPQNRVIEMLNAGQAIQRFWLTATKLGLAVQPTMATLIFAQYGSEGGTFTQDAGARRRAVALAKSVEAALPKGRGDVLFMGRIGSPRLRRRACRSVRRPLSDLMTN